jgi:uncharacterized protein (TIGR03437 family)
LFLNWRLTIALFGLSSVAIHAATFGTVVPVRGTVSDIALDESRNRLYIADFSGYRIDVLNTSDLTLGTPLSVFKPPSAIALSPDNRYLVVGHFDNFTTSSTTGGFTIFDLQANTKQQVAIGSPVLSVAFGAGSQALIVTGTPPANTAGSSPTTGQFLLLDPATAKTTVLGVGIAQGIQLPVPFANFPADIVQATTGISGDRQTIVVFAEVGGSVGSPGGTSPASVILAYRIGSAQVQMINITSAPPLGPVAVSVNKDATALLAGWLLFDGRGLSQFPYPVGTFRGGGHAWDYSRNIAYADIPVAAGESPVMHVVDTDNLAVRERIQLPQMMAGRSILSRDLNTLYAISDSGVMVLPVGSLSSLHQVIAQREDLLFEGDACNRSVITQTLNIVDTSGGHVDFNLSVPSGTSGVQISPSSGTTPARVTISVDPTVYQNTKGTTTVPLTITSSGAINLPFPVRLLINTRDMNQRGTIVDVPGKLTDILADRVRNRVYIVRQDKNLVLVYDTTTFKQIAALRTGNTPMNMAITEDNHYLIVGNDNSQFASVFDLNTLQAAPTIPFPNNYPHSLAVGHGAIFATTRPFGSNEQLFSVDFAHRTANPPPSLGIYQNGDTDMIPGTAALAASPSENYIFLILPNGTVVMWDASVNEWVVSRKDFSGLSGAFGVLSDTRFLAGANVLDQSLFPVATLESTTGSSSGIGLMHGIGLRTTTATPSSPGTIERIDLNTLQTYNGTPTIEAAQLASTLQTPPIGQIGETILPFTRTLAVPHDQSSIISLSQSGLMVIPADFDKAMQVPVVTSVINSADGGADVAPGGLVIISGTGLAPDSASSGAPFPTSLGDVCVTADNTALALSSVSSNRITAQLPFTVSGDVPLLVRNPAGISPAFELNILDFAPAIFHNGTADGQHGLPAVVRDDNNQLVTFTNPIHPETTISIFLTGLSETSPPATLGAAAPSNPPEIVATPPTVTLEGTTLNVTFAGLVPGQVGVYQIDAHVPRGIKDNKQAKLVVSQGGVATSLVVRVVNP